MHNKAKATLDLYDPTTSFKLNNTSNLKLNPSKFIKSQQKSKDLIPNREKQQHTRNHKTKKNSTTDPHKRILTRRWAGRDSKLRRESKSFLLMETIDSPQESNTVICTETKKGTLGFSLSQTFFSVYLGLNWAIKHISFTGPQQFCHQALTMDKIHLNS